VDYVEHDFVEPPKISHKKKTEKEKERERLEKEAALKAAEFYKQRQIDMNRPVNPREPLKRTADNNWVHVTCAVFTPEVKFGMAKALSPAEGIPSIPRARFAETCKACKKTGGACVSCFQCHAPVHVECAHHAGYVLGFQITPVKASRRDQHSIVTMNGETGVMSAEVWCKEHWAGLMKQPAHPMHEMVDDTGLNALQLYVQNFKQADLTLTGCARKANQISLAAKTTAAPAVQAVVPNRRASLTNMVNGDRGPSSPPAEQPGGKVCLTCGIDTSPKWYPIDQEQERGLTNGYYGNLGEEAQKFVEQRSFQCHKCRKMNRQPNPHRPREKTAEAEPLRQAAAALAAPSVAAPPARVEIGPANRAPPYAWSPPPPPASMAIPAPGQLQAPAMSTMSAPMMQPVQAPHPIPPPQLPPTIAPRGGPPIPQHPYSMATAPHSSHSSHLFGDWHRNPPHSLPQHGPMAVHSHREINGGPPPPLPQSGPQPPLAPPNHLRPPPMSSMAHPLPPPSPGHVSYHPQYMNGGPPSPRRHSGGPPPPPMPNGGPYMPSHHNMAYPPPPPPPPPHSPEYANGPPRMPILRDRPMERPPMYQPHNSPPLPRDQPLPPLSRDPVPPPPQRENRPPSGASASPSLRNLLS